MTRIIDPSSGEVDFSFMSDQGAYIPITGICSEAPLSTYQDAAAKRDAANLGVPSILKSMLGGLKNDIVWG